MRSSEKKRLDMLIFENGFAQSREKAKAIIMAGNVYVNSEKADKPGMLYPSDSSIEVRGKKLAYVSRGGLKLEKAIKEFSLSLSGKITLDVGASTGGFTDCMLKNGALKVYSVDVGYGQLAWQLRNDPRVINLERTNIRYVTNKEIFDKIDFFSIDVSFISLTLVLPAVKNLLSDTAQGVCLIKPQFEAGREKVGKNGVVREKSTHEDVIKKVIDFVIQLGFTVNGLTFSPIKGPQGNIEYLLHLKNSCLSEPTNNVNIIDVVENSHTLLK